MKKKLIILFSIFIILCLFDFNEIQIICFSFSLAFFLAYINKNSMISLITSIYFIFFGIIIDLYNIYELNYLFLIVSGFFIFTPGIIFPFVSSKKNKLSFKYFYNFLIVLGIFIALLGFLTVTSTSHAIILSIFSLGLYIFLNFATKNI